MAKILGRQKTVNTLRLDNLRGGMNVENSPEFIADNECVNLENFEFDIDGNKLRTRRGLGSPLHLFNSPITYIYNDFELNEFYVFLKDKSIYMYEYGKSPVFVGKLNGNSTKPSCAKWAGNLLIASGSKLQRYSFQDGLQELASSPDADIVFVRRGRVVVAKAGQDLLCYSAIGQDDNWEDESNTDASRKDVEIGYKDGGDILGAFQLATDIVVFKSNGLIYDIQNDPPDWHVNPVGENSDFLSRLACTNLNKDVVYLSNTGLKTVSSSEIYGNFDKKDIGSKCNPEIRQKLDNPYLSDLRRTKQLIVSGYSGEVVYVYHYALQAFTKWVFPLPVTSICENRFHTLVSMNNGEQGGIYELSFTNTKDNGKTIPQKIQSKELRDTHDMNLYRTYVDIQPVEGSGKGSIFVNNVELKCQWSDQEQQQCFKTQIQSPIMHFTFTTENPIIFKFISFDIVVEKEAMVAQQSPRSGGGKRGGLSGARRKKHSPFLENVNKDGDSPYG